jgi:hypothetical protein
LINPGTVNINPGKLSSLESSDSPSAKDQSSHSQKLGVKHPESVISKLFQAFIITSDKISQNCGQYPQGAPLSISSHPSSFIDPSSRVTRSIRQADNMLMVRLRPFQLIQALSLSPATVSIGTWDTILREWSIFVQFIIIQALSNIRYYQPQDQSEHTDNISREHFRPFYLIHALFFLTRHLFMEYAKPSSYYGSNNH